MGDSGLAEMIGDIHLRLTRFATMAVLGGLVFGCSQAPAPTKSSPSASPSAMVSATASASPSASASASPSASPSASGSPQASASPSTAPEVGYTRKVFEAAGVEFSVPENFSEFEKLDGGWLASVSPDKKMMVLVRAHEWKEWDDVLKACDDLFHDFKASDGDVTKDKTSDGIEVWYDFGAATVQGKPWAVLVAGYQLQEHDFDMVICGDPDSKGFEKDGVKILSSVTRDSKYQKAEDEKSEEEK